MGRHSASYIAERRGRSGRQRVGSASSFVGRVGGLAVALGVGAAVMGSTAIAGAEGPTDDSAGATPAHAAPDTATTTTATTGTAQPNTGASAQPNAGTHPTVPQMQLGNGRTTTGQTASPAAASTAPSTSTRPASLPEVIAEIPQKIVAALTPPTASPTTPPTTSQARPHSSGASAPTTPPDLTAHDTGFDSGAGGSTARSVALTKRADVAQRDDASAPTGPALATPTSDPTVAKTITTIVVEQRITPVSTPAPVNPIAMVVANVLTALGIPSTATDFGGSPVTPFPVLQAALLLIHREIDHLTYGLAHLFPTAATPTIPTNAVPSTATAVPTPADEASTPYGDIGKWMLQSDGQISNYGGLPYAGKTVLEPVNVIIVDRTSTSAAQSAAKLNTAMFWSGFPAQPIHTTGFQGVIDDVTYGQQPTGPLLGFSDGFFLFDNDHGRIFGPDPVETDTGYVWSGAFSTERLVLNGLIPAHAYVSSNMARTALATRLIASGQAMYGGMVPLNNAYVTDTTTTGDHDGYAVVVVLR